MSKHSPRYRVRTNHNSDRFCRNGIIFGREWLEVDASAWTPEQHDNLLTTPVLDVEAVVSSPKGKDETSDHPADHPERHGKKK